MTWIIIIIIAFICTFLLVARLYITKVEKTKEMPTTEVEESGEEASEAESDE